MPPTASAAGPVPAKAVSATARLATASKGFELEYRKPPRLNARAASILKIGSIAMQTYPDVQTLELKIPPVALVIIAALLMWGGAVFFPMLSFRFPFQSMIVWAIGLAGVATSAIGVVQFKRAKTTVNPTRPGAASSLVRTGIYARTRNPMYVGFLLILTGWAFAVGNVASFLILPAFVLYMNRFQIEPEERALQAIFGDAFEWYCSKARRWI